MVIQTIDGRYRLGKPLGAGGMGRVYAAEDLATGITVAVKVLFRGRLGAAELLEQARAMEQLVHPNVVRVLDHGTAADGAPYIVMERLRGSPLGLAIRRDGALPFARVLRIAGQLLAGLVALHDAGLVHADVKSDNVMVDAQAGDRAKIIDLGIARAATAVPRMFTCTPEYVAPEVVCGDPPTVASDLYGVGIILYEMVTGTTPFAGGRPEEIFERHVSDAVVPMAERCPERHVPPELEQLIERVLAKQAAARPRNAAELARELQLALDTRFDDDQLPAIGRFSTRDDTRDWIRPTFERTATWHRPPQELRPTSSRPH